MQYRIRDDLSYCIINGHAVFLDIEADRYFCLPDDLEQAFLTYAAGADLSGTTVPMLLERGILTPREPRRGDAAPRQVSAPLRSAREMPDLHTSSPIVVVPELMATVWTCRRQIRTEPLKEVLDRNVRYKQGCLPQADASGPICEQQLLKAACIFRRARLYIPIATSCLLDSLALSRFLARRHFHSDLVFGVTYEPFSAHCWVQAGDIALNETVGDAMTHTVIRVV